MKNISFLNILKRLKKRRLAFKKRNNERLLKNRGYRDFIAKVKNKKLSDDAILEILELSYLKI